jgi:hypothetical protein
MKIRRFVGFAAAFVALSFSNVVVSHVVEYARAAFTLPGTTGPSLGDFNVNVFTLAQAINLNNQNAVSSALTANNTASQATCTALVNPLNQITASAATGSVCLPPAFAGRIVLITNTTANALNLYGSNTPQTSGTQDTINGTTGSTANTTVLPTTSANKSTICFSPANGAWNCTVAA